VQVISLSPGKKPGTAYCTFPYDPDLVSLIKQIPGREWDKARRVWILPLTPENIAFLRGRVPRGVEVRMAPDLEREVAAREGALASAAAVKDAGDSEIDFDYFTQPYAHQRAGLDFLAKLGSGALLWEMGLGKTKTAIDYAEWLHRGGWVKLHAGHFTGTFTDPARFRVLVICPNTVKRNWGQEIEKHAGHTRFVIPEGTLKKRALAFGTATYTIINCELLSYPETARALMAREWDFVIVDESTRFKGPTSARTKALHKIPAKARVILTGTPITGKPEDAWAQMHFVDPGMLGSWWGFVDRYLRKNPWTRAIEGIRPEMAGDLAARIASRSYRIRKDEVLDLPPKVYEDRLVEMGPDQKRHYEAMKNDLRMVVGGEVVEAWNILTQLLRLTQITAGLVGAGDRYQWLDPSAKLAELDDLLDDLAGEQVVIFGIYQKELEALAARYKSDAIIYGPTPEKQRAVFIDQFQRGERRLLFVQSHTGGIGINLTAAKYAVYYSRGWSLEDWLQSQDRLHRIGQTGTVTIVTLTAKNTIDERIAKVLGQKQNIADALTGDDARALAREILGD